MKKRIAVIGAALSLMPLGQSLVVVTGAALTSAAVILSVPEKAHAESADFYYNRGIDAQSSEDHYGAISDFNKAIDINSNFVNAYYARGWSKNHLKDYKGALSDLNKVIKIDQKYKQAYIELSFSKIQLEDYYGAISDLNKVIKMNPNNLNIVFRNRGIAKEGIGDMKGACSDWRKASSYDDEFAPDWVKEEC